MHHTLSPSARKKHIAPRYADCAAYRGAAFPNRAVPFSRAARSRPLQLPALGLLPDLGEAPVQAVLPDKLIVGALLGDAPVLHHQDLVGILHSGQTVRDGDEGLAAGQLGERLLDEVLVLRVDAGSGLVQNDDGRVLQDSPCNGDALLLAAGQGAAALAHHGVVAVRQLHDEVVAAGFLCRRDHLVLRGVRSAEQDVGADGVMEQIHVLEHHGDVGEQAVAGELPEVVAAHGDAAGLGVVKPRQQAAYGGLAAAGGADDGGGGLLRDGEGDVLQHLPGIVAEVHVSEPDVIVLQCDVPAARVDEVLTAQGVQLVHGIVDDAQRVGAVADRLKTCKNAEGEEHKQQRQGEIHFPAQALQRRRQCQSHAAAFQRQQVQCVAGHIAPFDLQVDVPAVPDGAGHGVHGRAAFAEGLDHRQTAGVFQNGAGHVTVGLRLHRSVDAAVMGDDQHEAQRQRRRQQRDERRHRAAHRKPYEDHGKVQIAAYEIVDHADTHGLQRGKPRGNGVEDIAGAHLLEISQRHPFQGVADGETVPGGELIADRLLQPRPEVVKQEPQQHQHHLYDDDTPDPCGIEGRAALL